MKAIGLSPRLGEARQSQLFSGKKARCIWALCVAYLATTCPGQIPVNRVPVTSKTSGTTLQATAENLAPPTLIAGEIAVPYQKQAIQNIAALLRPALSSPKPTWRSRLFFQQLEEVSRFNYMDSAPHKVDARDMQYRIRARAQVKLLASDRTYLESRAETGKGFNNSWNNTGIGKDEGQSIFDVKTFALGQKIKSLELQVGGIEFDQGSGTQHTYASGDGALVGYRAQFAPRLNADQSVRLDMTVGYVGDFDRQNVFSRLRLDRVNYYQALMQKHYGPRTDASFEVDSIQNIVFLRPALHYRSAWRPLLDELTVESVLRTNDDARFAWSATAIRPFDIQYRWLASIIYSDIPYNLYRKSGQLILANQGEIDMGKRISWGANYIHDKNLNVGLFAGRRLDNTVGVRWVVQASVGYQYNDLLNHLIH